MNVYELQLLFTQLTYKPGTKFELHDTTHYGERVFRVLITQQVMDAKDPLKMSEVFFCGSGFLYKDIEYLTQAQVLDRVFCYLVEMEAHEVKEFFKVGGKHYKEPHPERWKEKSAI